jgi:protein ImuA
MKQIQKAEIIAGLQADILRLQGFKSVHGIIADVGLEPIYSAFPNASFPLGAVHEFLSSNAENNTATTGFIAALLASITESSGALLWISSSRTLFPPALKNFGIDPDRIIFIDLQNERQILWAMEEGLKCGALSAVVGEIKEISFEASRRLQLAVEQSQVTGFILRKTYRLTTTACVTRWKIMSLPSEPIGDLPGIGFPKWRVELLRVRNGKPGVWDIEWVNGRFAPVYKFPSVTHDQQMKAG